MLATTVALGADVATYRDPDHPTQLAVLRAIDDLASEQATNLAVDGCGAPLFALTLYGLARAGRAAAADPVPCRAERRACRGEGSRRGGG